nr:long-chain-fatty-acid-CoA ligase [Catenulispora sp.]
MDALRRDPDAAADQLVALLRRLVEAQPDELACVIVDSEGEERATLTYREYDTKARAVAAALQEVAAPGDRAILFLPTSTDFLVSLLACAYSGVMAVPVPDGPSGATRLSGILEDCEPRVLITDATVAADPAKYGIDVTRFAVLVAAEVPDEQAEQLRPHTVHPDDVVIMQYTSGSTSEPKGVLVSHRNVLANLKDMAHALPLREDERLICVSWLPLFHDMGMVQIMHTLAQGGISVLMTPTSFIMHPRVWLETIGKYRAQLATAPNFGYLMCVDRIPAAKRAGLDLSHWRYALNGSEPIHAETLDTFVDAFSSVGFDRTALMPGYGLAESTFYVSGRPGHSQAYPLSIAALENEGVVRPPVGDEPVRRLVTAGPVAPSVEVRIVDPDTRRACAPDRVGEIWVRGEGIAAGYWRKDDGRFSAVIDGEDASVHYLRTRDFGVLIEDELYVLGRVDDVIILDGRNHFPQDLELSAWESHEAITPGRVAAFGYERDGKVQIGLVAEVGRRFRPTAPGAPAGPARVDPREIVRAVRTAVTAEHQVPVADIVLVAGHGLPRTTSGKIQRRRARALYLADELKLWAPGHRAAAPAATETSPA